MISPPGMAVTIFRLQSYFFVAGLYPVSKILAVLNIILYGVEIDPGAHIDEGFVIGHANGIVIHRQVRIGKNCLIMHQNGISPNCWTGYVEIGDNVTVGAGAKIIGVISIGDKCIIGMNAVVTKTLPPFSVAGGVPARIIKTIDPAAGDEAEYPKPPVCTTDSETAPAARLWQETRLLIAADLRHRAKLDGKHYSWFTYVKLLPTPPALAVVIGRLQRFFHLNGWKLVAKVLGTVNIIFFSVEIAPGAEIGPGFVIGHANGVIITDQVTLGRNCMLTLQNSIAIGPRPGQNPWTSRAVLEDNVLLGAGARIVGNLTVGHDSMVGMNAVVIRSAPPFSLLAGVPATIIGSTEENTPREEHAPAL